MILWAGLMIACLEARRVWKALARVLCSLEAGCWMENAELGMQLGWALGGLFEQTLA